MSETARTLEAINAFLIAIGFALIGIAAIADVIAMIAEDKKGVKK